MNHPGQSGLVPAEAGTRTVMAEQPTRVLVVDDEPMARELTILALERDGFECDPAIHGAQALKMLAMGQYAAVVTDLRMPELNGHALATELLSRPDRPVVFVMTGVTEPRLIRDLLARGVDDVFFKPVQQNLLALKLAVHLERKRSASAASEAAFAP